MELLEHLGERTFFFTDQDSGLRAVLCIDDLTLGPAAGGIRSVRYPSMLDGLRDAQRLAGAMTEKCALAGLAAGGAKTVVFIHPNMNRAAAFRALGRRIQELGGMYRSAGDLGTTDADLAAVAEGTEYVHLNSSELAGSVARSTLRCIEACAERRGRPLDSLHIGIQGCGAIGAALAHVLAEEGARVSVSDIDPSRANTVAAATGAQVHPPESLLSAPVDILSPCAIGGVIDSRVARELRAFAVCGAANNILTGPDAAETLRALGILHVPDILASAGGVIDGIGATVMGMPDRNPLIDRLKYVAASLLQRVETEGRTAMAMASEMARERIQGARR